ncbi:MAG: hypothetical protein WCF85_14770 [Rhodospirillaceae bacterium]
MKTKGKGKAILNPEHLLELAEKLIAPPPKGPPRQVYLRRAISSAYYGIFHAVLAAAADEFVGKVHQGTKRYALVYRKIDHKGFIDLCQEVTKSKPSDKYASKMSFAAFGSDIQAFATDAIRLQKRRHEADYDPLVRFKTSHCLDTITEARRALNRFKKANEAERKEFLTLLLFLPR